HTYSEASLFLGMMLWAFQVNLAWRPFGHLLIIAVFQKTLFICLVNDFLENSLGVIWFSNGNGSMLNSYTYGIFKEEDGSFSTIAQISIPSKEFESWNIVICSVAQNQNSRIWNTTSLQISGIYQRGKKIFKLTVLFHKFLSIQQIGLAVNPVSQRVSAARD
uniref:Uncharacterized protein n=1 Tax=Naja naja TaxID=35670 RepID=A0A8C6V9Y8_NAJNA